MSVRQQVINLTRLATVFRYCLISGKVSLKFNGSHFFSIFIFPFLYFSPLVPSSLSLFTCWSCELSSGFPPAGVVLNIELPSVWHSYVSMETACELHVVQTWLIINRYTHRPCQFVCFLCTKYAIVFIGSVAGKRIYALWADPFLSAWARAGEELAVYNEATLRKTCLRLFHVWNYAVDFR